MNANRIAWGILGSSFISEVMAEAICESAFAKLAAVGSRNIQTGEDFAAKFFIPKVYTDYHDLLNDPEIDAVYIGLPNHLHKEWILHAAAAGKHILCEKPLVLTPDEMDEVLDAVEAADVMCMEALMYRHHPFPKKLKAIIDSGVMGNIKLFSAAYTADIAAVANPTAGGSLRNLGCYPLSLIRWLANDEPEEISALGRKSPHHQHDNQASILLKFPHNKMAMVSTADDLAKNWHFEVHGDNGVLKVLSNPWMPEKTDNIAWLCLNEADPLEIRVDAEQSVYCYQIDVMSKNILSGNYHEHDAITLHESLGNVEVIAACIENMST